MSKLTRFAPSALVPVAVAVALPLGLARMSLFAAGLSLPVAVALVFLARQIQAENRSRAAWRARRLDVESRPRSVSSGSGER